MSDSKREQWERFKKFYFQFPEIELRVDLSRMDIDEAFLKKMEEPFKRAWQEMMDLERGTIANPDENRMVGHYWLRTPELAPTTEITREIQETQARIKDFAGRVHKGLVTGGHGTFRHFLLIGIGGSALGPQFVASALGHPLRDKLQPHFLDNTDPDGIERVIASLGDDLKRTLCIVISKSGSTKETRNGMLEAKNYYERQGLKFSDFAVAVTQQGSELDKYAVREGWIERFPMWDWVGGRTSELSAVGLLPAALHGIEIDAIISGAKACDAVTRAGTITQNPAFLLASAWFQAGDGKGSKNMVVIPYKDRLELFSKYLQQLIMESLGKEFDRHGRSVHQGIAVFGNKGSTDQHSYVQQLRDGLNNFFVTFIQVLKDSDQPAIEVETATTSGDYLHGFYLGTREALAEKSRHSISLVVDHVSPKSVGVLISLFERAVGYYANLVDVNAYHQPGVEAGKKAAAGVLQLQQRVLECLPEHGVTVDELAASLNNVGSEERIFKICEHLAISRSDVRRTGFDPAEARFSRVKNVHVS